MPPELRAARRWVLWALVRKGGRWTKRPLRPDGPAAGSTDPATWTDFDTAVAAHRSDPARLAGLGFVLGDGWCGVDLDDVRHPDGGPRAWAAALLDALGTYAERSPSDTGVKLVGRGAWAGGWHKRPHPAGGRRRCTTAAGSSPSPADRPGRGRWPTSGPGRCRPSATGRPTAGRRPCGGPPRPPPTPT